MTNLLEETIEALKDNGNEPSKVVWVGSADGEYGISWNEFVEIAKDVDYDYDNGYGGEEVPLDLVVVGNGWWLRRWEYNGIEGWEYVSQPYCKTGHKPFTVIIPVGGSYWSGHNKLHGAQKIGNQNG